MAAENYILLERFTVVSYLFLSVKRVLSFFEVFCRGSLAVHALPLPPLARPPLGRSLSARVRTRAKARRRLWREAPTEFGLCNLAWGNCPIQLGISCLFWVYLDDSISSDPFQLLFPASYLLLCILS